jgi:hypothetical protein
MTALQEIYRLKRANVNSEFMDFNSVPEESAWVLGHNRIYSWIYPVLFVNTLENKIQRQGCQFAVDYLGPLLEKQQYTLIR